MTIGESPFASDPSLPELVLLLHEPLAFEPSFLQGAVMAAFGVMLPTDEPDAEEFVTGEMPIFFVQLKGRLLQVKSMPIPYFEPEVRQFVTGDPRGLRESITDRELLREIDRHKGWISATLMNPDVEPQGKDRFRYPSRMLSAFALEEIAALVWPAENRAIAWEFDMQQVLRKGKGRELFE